MNYYVYIMTSPSHLAIYVGVTNDLVKRTYQHKEKQIKGFTQQYNITKLVYFEEYKSIEEAIAREKQLKKWNRAWKFQLIKNNNSEFKEIILI